MKLKKERENKRKKKGYIFDVGTKKKKKQGGCGWKKWYDSPRID